MRKATVQFDIEIPDNVSVKQIIDFLNFELQIIGDLGPNPLDEMDELSPSNLIVQ